MRTLRAAPMMLLLALAVLAPTACRKPAEEPPVSAKAPAPRAPGDREGAPGAAPAAPPPLAPVPAHTAGTAPEKTAASPDDMAPGYRLQDAALPPGTVARLEGEAVSVETLKAFSKLLRSGGAFGHQEPSAVRTAALLMALDQILAGRRLTAGTYANDPRMKRLDELYRLLYVGKRYEREKLLASIVVSEAEVAARMPSSREELRLRLLVLDPAQEETIRAAFAAGTPFEQLVLKHSLTGGGAGMGEFGWQRRGQTIFGPDGEELIWGTPAGNLTPVVETAIGPVLAQVLERRTTGDAEWAQARETVRGQIAGRRAAVYTNAIVGRHKGEIDHAAMRRLTEAMAAEDRASDAVVGRVDAIEIWFHDLDRMMEVSYQDIMLEANAEGIRNAYNGFFNRVATGLALGLEARAIGMRLTPEDEAGLRAALGRASLRVALQDVLKGVAVGREEIDRYYREHAGRYSGISAARLQAIAVKDMETALEVAGLFRDGKNFTELVARYSIDTASQARGGDMGLRKGDQLPPEVVAGLLETEVGELIPIYESGGQYIVALVHEKRMERPMAEPEARAAIARNLLKKKRSDAVREYLVTLRGGEQVEFDRAQFEAIPLEKKAAMPSRHGGHSPAGTAPAQRGGMPAGHPAPGGGR